MTPLAQPDIEHWQDIVSSKSEPIETPVDHVEPVEQGSMSPPITISTGQWIDPNMSTEDNINFVDDLSQEPSPLLDKEGTCQSDTTPSNEHEETLHSLVKESKPETSPSDSESSSIEGQDISSVIMPKGDSVDPQTFLLLKVNLAQPCLIVKKVL